MKNKGITRKLTTIGCAITLAVSLIGCKGNSENTQIETTQKSENRTVVYGKVTAVDETEITLSLGEMKQMGAGAEGENANGEAVGNENMDKQPPTGENASGEAMKEGTPPEKPDEEQQTKNNESTS